MEFKQKLSKEIFEKKYQINGEQTPEEVFKGIAKEISSKEKDKNKWESIFYDEMISGRLMPGGRILANARPETKMKNYNNCFTIDIEDDMQKIYDSLKEDALISKMGGGVGFNISKLRPKNDTLSIGGASSGPISFLRVFDQSAKIIMTGGQRRAAHIAILNVDHPDIEEFITVKQGDTNKELTQFNISVGITDDFINAVENDLDWDLKFNGKIYKTLKAKDLYDKMVNNAFINNEPGILNLDTVERYNNGWWAFKMDRTNPCGEICMPSYSLCCLSSINLTKFVIDPFSDNVRFDYEGFKKTIAIGVRFLDNVLDVTQYPLEKIETFSKKWRRIGLGFTGLGDTFAMMRMKYGSEDSKQLSEKIGECLRNESYLSSVELAKEKGSFPECDIEKLMKSNFIKKLPNNIKNEIKNSGLRNIGINTLAPTGTTSLTIGHNCSSGIEPIFSLQYDRTYRTEDDKTNKETVYDNAWLEYKEMYGEDVDAPEYFSTTLDIDVKDAIDIQAIFQEYIDHSISKTANLPMGYTIEQYKDLFLYAYKKGLKGFTSFNPSGCCSLNTEIKTNKGNIKISELFTDDMLNKNGWYDYNGDIKVFDLNNEEKNITKLYVNGNVETYIFSFEDGDIFECTENHKFLVNTNGKNEWVEAKNIKKYHEIVKF